MNYTKKEIKKGIKLHILKTDKFKTNLMAVFLTTKLERETVTANALISAVLRRGSHTLKTQEEISKQLEELYGASFDCGIDKTGDNQVLKFYIETVNDAYLPQSNENILKSAIENILDIIFNPLVENNAFKKEYVEQEKINMKQRIEGRIDNKRRYALDRCIEEMYKGKPFGLYRFGYVEDLNNINEVNLYERYQQLIKQCKIDIFVSGNVNEEVENIIGENQNIKKLEEREPNYNTESEKNTVKQGEKIETMDVMQGKLVVGLDVNSQSEDEKYNTIIYNTILGGSANSKIFQNVREKANLAYEAGSRYFKYKDNIFVNCGIEISNYEKALNLVKEQIKDIKNGDFTDEEVENAKKMIISSIELIDDEQDTSITYYFGQEMSGNQKSVEDYIKRIEQINKDDVVQVANKIEINTIYFLRN